MTRRTLTPKQERFCEEYLVDLAPRAAAARAGLSPGTGSQLMAHPKVLARIEELKAARSARVNLKADDVLAGLHAEATKGDMNEPNPSRIRAWELIGKHLGMFVDRKQLSIKRIEDMTEAELAMLVGEEGE